MKSPGVADRMQEVHRLLLACAAKLRAREVVATTDEPRAMHICPVRPKLRVYVGDAFRRLADSESVMLPYLCPVNVPLKSGHVGTTCAEAYHALATSSTNMLNSQITPAS